MLSQNTEVIEYTTATHLAAVYRQKTERIRECLTEAQGLVGELAELFDDGYAFRSEIEYRGRRNIKIDELIKFYKLTAWSLLIAKTGVRKVMSSKRQDELDKVLHSREPKDADQLPDISEETIFSVLQGYAQCAEDFLAEAIREEYDWLRPWRVSSNTLKTNQRSYSKLDRKVILHNVVSTRWGGTFDVNYDDQRHITSVDNIFHALDGQGMAGGHAGPLTDTIRITTTADPQGETDYFRFKCFAGNGNLHLEFKRADLLERFNLICGKNYLPG